MCRTFALAILSFVMLTALPSLSRADGAKCAPDQIKVKYPALAGKTFKIGITGDSKPFAYRDPSNFEHLIGFSADYARATFSCIGAPFDFRIGPFAGLIPAVAAGQTDLVWSKIFYTPEHARALDFVIYMRGSHAVVVAKGNPKNVHAMSNLCGLRASALVGGIELIALNEASRACTDAHKPEISIISAKDKSSALLLLTDDRVDAYLGEGTRAAYDATTSAIAFTFSSNSKVGVGVHKGDNELERAIFNSFRALDANGTVQKLYNTYGMDPALRLPPEILVN